MIMPNDDQNERPSDIDSPAFVTTRLNDFAKLVGVINDQETVSIIGG